jgi:hypothetical protein
MRARRQCRDLRIGRLRTRAVRHGLEICICNDFQHEHHEDVQLPARSLTELIARLVVRRLHEDGLSGARAPQLGIAGGVTDWKILLIPRIRPS